MDSLSCLISRSSSSGEVSEAYRPRNRCVMSMWCSSTVPIIICFNHCSTRWRRPRCLLAISRGRCARSFVGTRMFAWSWMKSCPSIARRVLYGCVTAGRFHSTFLSWRLDPGTRILGATRGRSLRQDSRLSPMLSTFAKRCCWQLRRPNADAWAPAPESDSPS